MAGNMGFGSITRRDGAHEVMLVLHTTGAPTASEWSAYIDGMRNRCEAVSWDLARTGSIVVTDGGAPSTAQRTIVTTMIAQGKELPRVAVVTDSLAVRTMARGLTIFNPQMRIMAPSEFTAAMAFAGLDRAQHSEVIEALARIEREQLHEGAVRTLAALRSGAR